MEGIQKAFRSAMSQADPNGSFSSISSALEKAPSKSFASAASVSSADQSQLLLTRSSRLDEEGGIDYRTDHNSLITRQTVSLWTCSKLCAICFVAGIFVGYTLKRRVRRWASKFLKGLKD